MSILVDTDRGPGTPFPPTMLFVLGFLGALWINSAVPINIGGPDLGSLRIVTLGPVRRALRIQPLDALRAE
jgi:hypothetical protein